MKQIKIKELKKLMFDILKKYGVSREDSKVVIEALLEAEISGVESHGLIRLKPYINRIEKGLINTTPNIKVVTDTGSALLIDGDNGLGQVVAQKTLDICFENLEKNTVVMASVRNSNHFGTTGYFSQKVAEKGYMSIITSNASPSMAPWGSMEPLLGTNPIATSFPASRFGNFNLDIATSASAKGKIRTAEKKGEKLPEGLAIDKFGNETIDPESVLKGGTILPLGQHKGYGLSMFIDAISAGLSTANLGYETESMFKSNKKANIGHFFLLIKIDDLVPIENFSKRMDDWFTMIKESEKRPGVEEIFIPGEIERRKLKEKSTDIFLNDNTYKELINL